MAGDYTYEELEQRVKELEDGFSTILRTLYEFEAQLSKRLKALESESVGNKHHALRNQMAEAQMNRLRRTLGSTISSIGDWQNKNK